MSIAGDIMTILHTIRNTGPAEALMILATWLIYVAAAIGLCMIIAANGLRHTARYHGRRKARRRQTWNEPD